MHMIFLTTVTGRKKFQLKKLTKHFKALLLGNRNSNDLSALISYPTVLLIVLICHNSLEDYFLLPTTIIIVNKDHFAASFVILILLFFPCLTVLARRSTVKMNRNGDKQGSLPFFANLKLSSQTQRKCFKHFDVRIRRAPFF